MAADKKTIMVIGGKETFLIRSLLNKLEEAKIGAFFVPAEVNSISAQFEKADLFTYYLDKGEKPGKDVCIYLNDMMSETNKRIILIGDQDDVDNMKKTIDNDYVAESFFRPLDIAKYIERVRISFSADGGGVGGMKSILIIDDDPTYMGVIRNWLRQYFKVAMVTSGAQALTWLAKNHADLILLDYEMPVVSGPQVLEMLRSEPNFQKIPVFFLTGKSDKQSVMKVVALKPQNYLLKTITKDELLAELGKFFDMIL